MAMKRKYGWVRDLPDQRDRFLPQAMEPVALPPRFDQRPNWPEIYSQGSLGSCVGQGTAGVCHYRMMRDAGTLPGVFQPSALFVYYNARALDGTVPYDVGTQIRSGIKAVVRWGFCSEKTVDGVPQSNPSWSYRINKFAQKPPIGCYKSAVKEQVRSYVRVPQTLESICGLIAQDVPVVFGFSVYDSFESREVSETGWMPIPRSVERVRGGHCVVGVGYDSDIVYNNRRGYLICRNSWGSWGDKGHFYMPYDFLLSANCSDFWAVLNVP